MQNIPPLHAPLHDDQRDSDAHSHAGTIPVRIHSLNHLALFGTRHAIDWIDDGMVRLLAGRQRLVGVASAAKRRAGLAQHDPCREQEVQQRAQRLARRCGITSGSAARLMALLIAEAHRLQAAASAPSPALLAGSSMATPSYPGTPSPLWRLLPPPHRWRPLLARLPAPLRQALGLRLLAPAVASPQAMRTLQPVQGRRLGIRVDDLGLDWVFELREGGLQLSPQAAEVTVSGCLTDLLRLASRMEDADTLFFQRKLTLTGDTELGLTLRNLLDRLPWESLPLGQRIVLQRVARLASHARDACRGKQDAA